MNAWWRTARSESPTLTGPASVPAGRRVYAVGDIHGRLDLLRALHEQIVADAAELPDTAKTLVYLGDYVDRGPRSCEVVELLIEEPLAGFDLVHLKGNHEDMMLEFLDAPTNAGWLLNGGDATLVSYGVDFPSLVLLPSDLAKISAELNEALPPSHRAFLDDLSLCHEEGDYLFVHAGVRPGVQIDEQEPFDFMWIRLPFLKATEDFGKRIVHGHTIGAVPDVRANRIGIDTGAYHTGCLTCLVLEGTDVRFLQT